MRTTLDIDDALFREFKKMAAEAGTTFRAAIEDAMRETLARQRAASPQVVSEPIVTYSGSGVHPGVNLNSNSDLLDQMELDD